MVVSTAIVVYWLIGGHGYDGPDPDYMLRPPWTQGQVLIGGMVAVLALVLALVSTILTDRDAFSRPWASLIGTLMLVSAVAAAILRVLTNPVVGANIGGGLAIMAGVPVCAVLAAGAGKRYNSAVREQHDAHR